MNPSCRKLNRCCKTFLNDRLSHWQIGSIDGRIVKKLTSPNQLQSKVKVIIKPWSSVTIFWKIKSHRSLISIWQNFKLSLVMLFGILYSFKRPKKICPSSHTAMACHPEPDIGLNFSSLFTLCNKAGKCLFHIFIARQIFPFVNNAHLVVNATTTYFSFSIKFSTEWTTNTDLQS